MGKKSDKKEGTRKTVKPSRDSGRSRSEGRPTGGTPVSVPDELRQMFPIGGSQPLDRPTREALSRYSNVPEWCGPDMALPATPGAVSYDSWADISRGQLRNVGEGYTRRLCLTAGDIRLEIVAERERSGWRFTGRVYRGAQAVTDYSLHVGRRRELPRAMAFYHWTSTSAPRKIVLKSTTDKYTFDGITWA